MASTGFSGPLVHGPRPRKDFFGYRIGKGMMPSAEFIVFHDDFLGTVTSNVPLGWTAAIVDAGCTITRSAAVSGGAILMDSDADNEGVACYIQKCVTLDAGTKFFMEVRVRQEDVSAQTFQFGLTDLTGTTNPEDLWTTVAADSISFGNLDAATLSLVYDKDNGGPVTDAALSSAVLSDNTWHTLAIGYDGVTSSLKGYLDGKLVVTAGTVAQVPDDVILAPFIGMLAGHATTADIAEVDYVRFVLER